MWELLERCHIFSTPFIGGQPDQTTFNLGEHNFGLQLLADIMTACPQDYQLMAQEATTRNLANDRRDDNNRSPGGEQSRSEDFGRDAEGSITEADYDPYAQPGSGDGSDEDTSPYR